MRFSGQPPAQKQQGAKQCGFTLIEIIVGMVVMAIAMVVLTSIIAPRARDSVEPVMEVKAAELAQTLMNELLAKSYDHHSDHNGSRWRCGESIANVTIPSCTSVIGPEEQQRVLYNDVDDFDTQGAFLSANALLNSSGLSIGDLYPNFSVRIQVSHDAQGFNGSPASTSVAKRIDIQVQLPSGSLIHFSAYRGNY